MFFVGDLVRKRIGRRQAKILSVAIRDDGNAYVCQYKSGVRFCAYEHDLVYYDENFKDSSLVEEKTMQLYSFEKDGKVLYCTKIGTNSKTEAVVEVKGTGEVLTLSDADLVEVIPYTFWTTTIAGPSINQNWSAPVGQIEKNDLLISFGKQVQLLLVVAVDTKNKTAIPFKGKKVVLTDLYLTNE